MSTLEGINRRDLIKWIAIACPALGASTPLWGSRKESELEAKGPTPGHHPAHPRLYYSAASLDRIRQTLASHPEADAALKKHGEELLAAELIPESVAEIGGGQQANYIKPANQIAEMGLTLGLLFHLTGEAKYADKLRDALLYYTHYVRWAGQGLADRSPPWHSELDTELFSFGYATGYDALHSVLSEADRKTITEGMVRLAALPILEDWVLPGKRIHSFDSMGHNWWGVCVAGGGLCALALLGDDPRAQEWIDAVDAGFLQWFEYPGNVLQNRVRTFERSGPSYEGVPYTNYGVSEYLRYRLAWQNTFPGRKARRIEPLEHLARFFLQTLYPTSTGSLAVNFGDSTTHADVTTTMMLLFACGLGTSDASRYLQYVHTHPESTLLTLLHKESMPHVQGDAPTSCIYPEMGWATMRSSWENDATFLAMKSGYTWNHAHADAGSFILFKQGVPLVIDSGTCAYSRPEYTTYYRQSRAHNVILLNGAGQPEEDINYGCKFPGQMHSLIDGLGVKYAYADATGPMARWFRRNYRHWLWSGDVIFIVDTVLAYTAEPMDWLLHYEGEYRTNADGSVTLKNGPAEAVVHMLFPPHTQQEETGLADHDPDRKVPYLAFRTEAAAKSQQFITAICLDPKSVPRFELLSGSDYVGIRAHTSHSVEELYLNLRAVNGSTSTGVTIGEWTTDAYFVHLTRPVAGDATTERYFMSDGSYLRRDGQSMLESHSKLTACWSSGDSVEVFSDDASNSILIAAERSPQRARWNGNEIAIVYDKARKLASFNRPTEG